MESPEEFTASNDHTCLILKGKRTKRQRPSSTASFSGGGDCDGYGGGDVVYSSIPSPTSSAEISTSTEEDEDMANCLILLAQGGGPPQEEVKIDKISDRRFTEIATATGKAGFYVYECKTCNRSFPSFQALGGHRASHKRPKTTVDEKRSSFPATSPPPPPKEIKVEEEREITKIPPPLPLALPVAAKGKVHECSICGAEFSSGQALGGHMRRHRAAPIPPTTTTTTTVTSQIESREEIDREKKRKILPLDLNLPAPLDQGDHHRDSKFQFVFSGPALVDCHY